LFKYFFIPDTMNVKRN